MKLEGYQLSNKHGQDVRPELWDIQCAGCARNQ